MHEKKSRGDESESSHRKKEDQEVMLDGPRLMNDMTVEVRV